MKTNLNEIVCIIDRSGSMASIASDAIGGFNTFLNEQKAFPGEAHLSLVLFDHEYLLPVDNQAIDTVPPLTNETYIPRGTTALLDAVGRTITTVGERLAKTPEEDRPSLVVVAILTDGMENASKEYNRARVAEMIQHQQEHYGWQFVFLGANMDAIQEAQALNIPVANSATFTPDAIGTQTAYDTMSRVTSSLRADVVSNSGNNIAWQNTGKTTTKATVKK